MAKTEENHAVQVSQLQKQIHGTPFKSLVYVSKIKYFKDLSEKNKLVTSEKKKIEAKLVDQKDYMDIKRECEILKDTQFSGTEKTKLESQTLEGIVLD